MCWPFQTPFHKFLRNGSSLIKKRKFIYARFDCFHARSLHENLHVSSCCLGLLCSQYLVVVQVVIWSEPGDVIDPLHPPVGLGWENVRFPSQRPIRHHQSFIGITVTLALDCGLAVISPHVARTPNPQT